ncbi:MAG: metal-dependent transcriptional regulator [Bacteroidetes bacterium]|nr:metal-dependent transcriptional regulator [Bacteroidota bacterium]
MTTSTEENYLKAIYHLSTGNQNSVLTSAIAGSLSTSSASVTDMIKKLSDKNMVEYERYRGVKITRKGEKVALSIIRRHRLWEVFLMDKLKFKWDEVHDLAEELEHVSSDEMTRRLDAYLGFPKFDPHGDPIPDTNGKVHTNGQVLLSDIIKKGKYILCGVNDHSPSFLQYLEKKGLVPGSVFSIVEMDEYDNSMQIIFSNKKSIFISKEISKNLLVRNHE